MQPPTLPAEAFSDGGHLFVVVENNQLTANDALCETIEPAVLTFAVKIMIVCPARPVVSGQIQVQPHNTMY
jgi:hypothetical protein